MTEEIYRLAAGLVRPEEEEEALLRLLCREAERRLTRQAGEGREECQEALLCAAAFLGAAGLIDSRCGQSAGGSVEKFSVGEVSVTTGSGGTGGGGSDSAGERLRRQAERMMAPYRSDGEGFAFLGVRG